jgi:hypothetical protein
VLEALGDGASLPLTQRLMPSGSGSDIALALHEHGQVGTNELLSWVLIETRLAALDSFIKARVSPLAALREQQGVKVRYEIPAGGQVRLSSLFATLEAHKVELAIDNYSVSQISLEQIFNFFASQVGGLVSQTKAYRGPVNIVLRSSLLFPLQQEEEQVRPQGIHLPSVSPSRPSVNAGALTKRLLSDPELHSV